MFRSHSVVRQLIRSSKRLYSVKLRDESQKANRIYKKRRLQNLCQNEEKYPHVHFGKHQFKTNTSIEDFIDKYMYLERGQSLETDNNIQMTGRLRLR